MFVLGKMFLHIALWFLFIQTNYSPRCKAALLTSYEITMQDDNGDVALSQQTNVPRVVQQSCWLTERKDGNPYNIPNFKL